jgi:stage II sporulation protein D
MSIPHPTPSIHRQPAVRLRRRCKLALAGVLLALFLLTAAAPEGAAATAQTSFTIRGHGWGHGIGMSQWGAYGYAKHGSTYRAILKHYYSGIAFGTAPDNLVRVRLRSGLKSVRLTCPQPFTASAAGARLEIPAGTTATTTYVDAMYRVVAGDMQQDFTAAVTFTPSKGALRLLTATDLGDTGPYRGTIRVLQSGGSLMMINRLLLESYLRGVVPREVSPAWPAEALKAQACAARAYLERSRNPGAAWDVYSDVRDQTYLGVDIEDSRTDAAIRDTAGVVPTFGGKAISAFYFSSSGGRTENIQDGWPGATPVDYLKGVSDPYDYYATRHNWGPLRRSAGQLATPLGTAVSGSLRAIYTVKRGSSPRIVKAAIIGSTGVRFMDGNMLRMKLNLNSTWAAIRSMSVSPATRDGASVAAGGSVTLKGRTYPALAAGAAVRLHSYRDGVWRSRLIATTRSSQDLGDGYSARYSTYSVIVKPQVTTQYYFAVGKAASPTTTVTVQ